MDSRLLSYYDRELGYLRELGSEFAAEFPKVAGQLGLAANECADPHVERLLEGFAFLAARVQLKIDAEFPRFTENLLDIIYPHCLAPVPSMAIVTLQPGVRQVIPRDGFDVPRGTTLHASVAGPHSSVCRYRTAHDLTLWPLEVASLKHSGYAGDLGEIRLDETRKVRGTLRLRLRALDGRPIAQLNLDRLPLFIRPEDATGRRLYELFHAAALGMLVREPDGTVGPVIRSDYLGPIGFQDEHALLPYGPRSFQGYRLLQEYFALPSRFMFVELRQLASGIRRCHGSEVEVVVLLDRHDPSLESAVSADHVKLFCTPAINLFERRADRILLSDRTNEYHVVPDRARPNDFEVHSVIKVTGHGESSEERRPFHSFYSCTERTADGVGAAYFTLRRRPRTSGSREQRTTARASYRGSDTFIALVDGTEGPYRSQLRQLSVSTLCTNRNLPLVVSEGGGVTDFTLESAAPVSLVRSVGRLSAPRASAAWGDTAWRLITHLSSNHLSLTGGDQDNRAAAFRELLQLHADLRAPATQRQIQGLRSVTSEQVVRRLPLPGPISFGRGLEVTLECDEAAFEGTSLLLFGAVMATFLAKYAAINSFTEVLLRGSERGEIMRFPARIGRRGL